MTTCSSFVWKHPQTTVHKGQQTSEQTQDLCTCNYLVASLNRIYVPFLSKKQNYPAIWRWKVIVTCVCI